MSNPLRILKVLDSHLSLPAELTLFGRSALALGYSQAPAQFHNTQDVDGILPLAWLQPPDTHDDFWRACARVPDVPEIQELFNRARPKVLAMVAV